MLWESKINVNQVVEIRSRTLCYFGVGAMQKVDDICAYLKNKVSVRYWLLLMKSSAKLPGFGKC